MIEISEKLVEKIETLGEDYDILKDRVSSIKGVSDFCIKESVDDLFIEILEFLPEEVMESVVVKFDAKVTELLSKLEKLEETIDDWGDLESTYSGLESGESIIDDLSWAKIGIDKNSPPPLR